MKWLLRTEGKFSAWLEGQSGPAKIEVQAEGYEPAASEPIPTTNGDQTVGFRLRPSNGWSGLVWLPNGEPAVGAEVALASHLKGVNLGRRKLLFREESIYRLTDTEGRFHFDTVKEARLIIAVHEQGYAERDVDKLKGKPIVRLQPWGRVEGVLRSSGRTLPDEKVCIQKRFWNPWISAVSLSPDTFVVTTDSNGRFVFEDVPPGDHALGHLFHGGWFETRTTVQVDPGQTTPVELGGTGRPVTGKIHIPKNETGFDFSHSSGEVKVVRSKPADLPNTARRQDFTSDEAYDQASKLDAIRRTTYWQSAEGLTAWRAALSYSVWFDADGTFHADDVPPGEYDFNVSLRVPGEAGRFSRPRPVGDFKARVVIPDSSALRSDEPTDLGTVELEDRWR